MKKMGKISHLTAKLLGQNLVSAMQNKLENQTSLSHSTLLDPRYKTTGLYNQVQAWAAEKWLTGLRRCTPLNTPPETAPAVYPSYTDNKWSTTGKIRRSTGFTGWPIKISNLIFTNWQNHFHARQHHLFLVNIIPQARPIYAVFP